MGKKIDYQERGQHGDPVPARQPGVLSPEELVGRTVVEPIKTGRVMHGKRCSRCGGVVDMTIAICQVCVPGGKPLPLGGANPPDPESIRTLALRLPVRGS